MQRIRCAARIYPRDSAEYLGGEYRALRQANRGAQTVCKIIGGAEYHIRRLCRNRCRIEPSENPPDASRHARAWRTP
jgi:hypothetical protein